MWKGEHHLYNFWLDTAGYEKLDCDSITIQNSSFYEMVYEAVAEIDNKMYGCIKIVSISLETDFYFEKDIMSVIEKSRNVVSWIIREKEMKNDVKKLMQIKQLRDWIWLYKRSGIDGEIGNRWWEAKSGNYWELLQKNPAALNKFKSDMGHRLRIATQNGATYELFSNTPIPESIKQWLLDKGIYFTELINQLGRLIWKHS